MSSHSYYDILQAPRATVSGRRARTFGERPRREVYRPRFARTRAIYSRGPHLLRTELAPELPGSQRLESYQRTHQPREDEEGDQRGDRHRHWDQRAAEDRHHHPGNAHAALLAQPEGVVSQ